ncbi:hypothetical protein B0H67DRAFT_491438 [Lasiosphaeris hirsuta]|uniref:Uncharacterized protein n=1 Tax=Lasiosphaeris hirsuta TaxID=260670 RepID=A0AA40A925_9PEZI|nr:hypothetical protein B0H67DRAFT_491438 [Lasiosphaeris hirsuta]
MPFTGDGRSSVRAESPRTGIAGWFSSTAAGSALGMSTPNDGQTFDRASIDATPETTPTKLRRNTTIASTADPTTPKSTVTATASRFMSAISSRFIAPPASPIIDDEICNLNIEAALFPSSSPSSPSDRDPFSPAAFKNLQMNALGLLVKMQSAYRDRVATLRELQSEKLAQREELEEAETRAQHLKMQLEGMARKAQEQEKAMQQLMEELNAERKARADERLATMSEGSMVSEDLGVDEDRQRRKWRKSGSTIKSEVGFDTDEESAESESVFSRCRSPTLTLNAAMDNNMMDGPAPAQQSRSSSSLAPPRHRPGQPQQMSAFQKIIKGIAGENEDAGTNGCRNCKGQDASVAWDTVGLLRDENKHLKQRVGQLEVAVESALDLVNGIGL